MYLIFKLGALSSALAVIGATQAQQQQSLPVTGARSSAVALEARSPRPAQAAPSLETSNPFDAQRAAWPDRIPPPPPAPPPPTPSQVVDSDMQLYGVVIVGATKRAMVKVGSRFSGVASNGRGFATLIEGQPLGEFTVSQIQPTHIVLSFAGGQQLVYFTKKADRSLASGSGTAPAPVQAATVSPNPPDNTVSAGDARSADAASTGQPDPTAGSKQSSAPGNVLAPNANAQRSESAFPNADAQGAASAAQNPMIGGLAAALAAARANAASGQGTAGKPNPVFGNPFNQKP